MTQLEVGVSSHSHHIRLKQLLIDFSLTVKAATLIFISGRGSAIASANKGNQVLFIIW